MTIKIEDAITKNRRKGNCILKCAAALCVFHPAIPPRSLPSVASSVSPDEVLYILFRFRVQRYNNYLTHASVLQKKMQKYVVKHKKRGISPPLFLINLIRFDYASNSGSTCVSGNLPAPFNRIAIADIQPRIFW